MKALFTVHQPGGRGNHRTHCPDQTCKRSSSFRSGRLLISEQHLILLIVIEILWCNFSQNAVEASREQLWLHVLIKVAGFTSLATNESVVK